jgi:hypothetical protein
MDLPDDLAGLERDLLAHAGDPPDASLRPRVLAAMREALRRERRSPWRLAAAAAAVLLWINFSMSAASNTTWRLDAGLDRDRIEAAARDIRALAPELSEREAYRQALRTSLQPAPAPASSTHRIPRRKEHTWDMH